MGLTRLAIQRPLTILMIIMMLVIMGYRSYTLMQVERLPNVDLPFVSVTVTYPGASPEDIQDQVTKPIEDAVSGVSGIDTLTSRAVEGVGTVAIQFNQGVNSNQAAIDVERQVAAARGKLPTDANDPVITKADFNAQPVMTLVFSGPQGQDALYQVAINDLQPRLESVEGVAAVNVTGGRTHQINVNLDPAKLAAYGISLQTVQQAVAANNVSSPAGSLDRGSQNVPIRAEGLFNNLDDIRNLVVTNGGSSGSSGTASGSATLTGQNAGGLVYLRDIATVQDGYATRTNMLRFNGADTVSIDVIKTSDANAIQVSDAVRAAVGQMAAILPPGAALQIANDSAVYTRASVEGVQTDLILAVLITGLVMLLFLHTIRSSFIVLLAIPTSLLATFLVMWALGFTLNTLTLMALTLVIGILVDDSIVVLENTERHLDMGKNPRQAALDGRAEIGLAAITITLVDVVVYMPVAFVTGIIGQFFRSYGLTIVATTLFSLAISFTLTPMLASQWLRGKEARPRKPRGLGRVAAVVFRPVSWLWARFTRGWDAAFDALANGYGRLIHFALRNVLTESLVVLIAAAALAAGLYLVGSGAVGSEFQPQEDDGQFTIGITMPPGTSLAATDAAARQAEQILRTNVPEAAMILTNVGASSGSFGNNTTLNQANLSVYLVDKLDRKRGIVEITNALRGKLAAIPDATTSVSLSSSIAGGGGGSGAILVQFTGSDINTLIDVTNRAEAIIRQVPGVSDVLNVDAVRSGQTSLVMDRSRLTDLNLTVSQVATSLRTALSGTQVGTYKQTGQPDTPVIVQVDPAQAGDVSQILQLPLTYADGKRIALGQVVSPRDSQAPARISRTDRQLVLNISANPVGRAAGDVSNDIEAALRKNMTFPQGYTFKFSGNTQQQRTAFADLGAALALSIVLIYMLLVALFQSWMHPLAIMLALPVSIVGAFGGLWLTGQTLNIISILGLVLLTGIVTKNAILIVDFTNMLRREEGLSRKEALAQAGRLRLRPILMTTAALIFALLPLLLSTGAGSETRAPMAAVVIGGNITSTLLSLVLVPVAYNALDTLAGAFGRLTRRLFGSQETPEEAPSPAGGE